MAPSSTFKTSTAAYLPAPPHPTALPLGVCFIQASAPALTVCFHGGVSSVAAASAASPWSSELPVLVEPGV